MNDWIDKIPIDDDWLLELLVDDELDERQKRRLLEFLDGEPEGWRRCALAFLESQSLTRDLPAPSEDEREAAARMRFGGWRRSARVLASAASLLLAFLLGMIVWEKFSGARVPLADRVGTWAESGRVTPRVAEEIRHGAGRSEEAVPAAPVAEPLPEQVTLVFDDGPDGGERRVPVSLVDASELEDPLLWEATWPIPRSVLRALERTGHRIERSRRDVTLDLGEDRRVVVPVEELKVVPVSYRVF